MGRRITAGDESVPAGVFQRVSPVLASIAIKKTVQVVIFIQKSTCRRPGMAKLPEAELVLKRPHRFRQRSTKNFPFQVINRAFRSCRRREVKPVGPSAGRCRRGRRRMAGGMMDDTPRSVSRGRRFYLPQDLCPFARCLRPTVASFFSWKRRQKKIRGSAADAGAGNVPVANGSRQMTTAAVYPMLGQEALPSFVSPGRGSAREESHRGRSERWTYPPTSALKTNYAQHTGKKKGRLFHIPTSSCARFNTSIHRFSIPPPPGYVAGRAVVQWFAGRNRNKLVGHFFPLRTTPRVVRS